MSSQKYWIWLAECENLSPRNANILLTHFGSAKQVFEAKSDEYTGIKGFRTKNIAGLLNKSLDNANLIIENCKKIKCEIITQSDQNYPDRLKSIYDPPIVLYVKGKLPKIDNYPVFGIVGTRACTPYGITQAIKLGRELSEVGFVVVTGLAKGIDTDASIGALRGGTATIGVIGSGVDVIYPAENGKLFDDIAHNGAVVSEYPPGTQPDKTHFPMRNRIISGLSVGIAVIEAPKRSGALITAARAVEEGRDVFSMPGNVDSAKSKGTNRLLREGATPLLSTQDIIDEYIGLYHELLNTENFVLEKKSFDNVTKVDYIDLGKLFNQLHGEEKSIAMILEKQQLLADEIIIETGLPAQNVLTTLTMLELSGYVRRDIYGRYALIKE